MKFLSAALLVLLQAAANNCSPPPTGGGGGGTTPPPDPPPAFEAQSGNTAVDLVAANDGGNRADIYENENGVWRRVAMFESAAVPCPDAWEPGVGTVPVEATPFGLAGITPGVVALPTKCGPYYDRRYGGSDTYVSLLGRSAGGVWTQEAIRLAANYYGFPQDVHAWRLVGDRLAALVVEQDREGGPYEPSWVSIWTRGGGAWPLETTLRPVPLAGEAASVWYAARDLVVAEDVVTFSASYESMTLSPSYEWIDGPTRRFSYRYEFNGTQWVLASMTAL